MGDVWAVLFMIGLLMQPLVVLGSLAYVVVVSVKIGHVTGRRGIVWQATLLHIALVAGIGFGLELLAARNATSVTLISASTFARATSFLMVPFALRRRLRTSSPAPREEHVPSVTAADLLSDAGGESDRTPGSASTTTVHQRTTANRIAWTLGVTGTLTPWLVGLDVKAYLQSQGQPTLPIASFLNPTALPILVISTLTMWSFPFLLLALAARYRMLVRDHPERSFRQRLWLVWLTFAGAMAGAVALFVPVFWRFDMIYVIVPLGLYYLPVMGLGYGLGVLMIRRGWIGA